jgi:hypothetical protein
VSERRRALPTWFLADVLAPFAAVRALLLVAAWYARQFAPSWTYYHPVAATRGWTYLPWWALDVWGRWDASWYLGLAEHGYAPPAEPGRQSNLAFFPLFPLLVRGLHALVPAAQQGVTARYLCALAVASAAALAGLALVHAWVRAEFGDAALARRTVLVAILFPGGFFLSCAYSESTFLLASAAALHALARGRPAAAGVAGLLAALTRPTGVLLALPIAVAARRRSETATPNPRRRRWLLAAALPPLGLLLHAANLWRVSGDPLAFLHAQVAWGRGLALPWGFLFWRPGTHPWTAPIDRAAIVLFLALGLALLLRERRAGLAAYALLSIAPLVLSGTPMSATRLVAAVFPAFVPLARAAAGERFGPLVYAALAALQALLFAAWTRFHWVA